MIPVVDALDLQVSGEFCAEDIIGPLVRVVGCTGVEKRGKLEFRHLYLRHWFVNAEWRATAVIALFSENYLV